MLDIQLHDMPCDHQTCFTSLKTLDLNQMKKTIKEDAFLNMMNYWIFFMALYSTSTTTFNWVTYLVQSGSCCALLLVKRDHQHFGIMSYFPIICHLGALLVICCPECQWIRMLFNSYWCFGWVCIFMYNRMFRYQKEGHLRRISKESYVYVIGLFVLLVDFLVVWFQIFSVLFPRFTILPICFVVSTWLQYFIISELSNRATDRFLYELFVFRYNVLFHRT